MGGNKENTVSGVAEHTSTWMEKEEEEGEEEEKEGSQHQPCHSVEEDNDGERSPKRMKIDHSRLKSPAFYFNLHRHSPKGKFCMLLLSIMSKINCCSWPFS